MIKILDKVLEDDITKDLGLDLMLIKDIDKVSITELDPNHKNYFVIFSRTPFFPEEISQKITNDEYALMQKGILRPLIMMVTEQWDLFETFKEYEDSPYKKFIKHFLDKKVPEENITWIVPDHNYLEQIKFLQQNKDIRVKCKFIQYNAMMQIMTQVAQKYLMPPHTITKHFSCLCKGRPRHNRIAMIYELWRNNILTHGNISSGRYVDITQTKGYDWIDDKITTESFMNNFEGWEKNSSTFKKMLPMDHGSRPNMHWLRSEYDESQLFESALVWIACETMHEQDGIFITEKTWKAIAYGKPFLLNGDPKSLEYLRSLGYKTFGSFWDESYDSMNNVDSIKHISDIVKKLCEKDIKEINNMYKDMLPILEHNKKLLSENMQHQNFIKDLQDG